MRAPAHRNGAERLAGEEADPDELAARSGLDAETVLRTLTALELRGAVERLGDGRYALNSTRRPGS